MAPVDAHNSAIPGAIPLPPQKKIGEDMSAEMCPNRHAEFNADR